MSLAFKSFLDSHPWIRKEEKLYYQKDFPRNNKFEQTYTSIRSKEQRLYADDVVVKLPEIQNHPLRKEWEVRGRSAAKLASFLKSKDAGNILEVGCGNGWLLNYLNTKLAIDCCGIDINEIELRQASTLFTNISFLYGDVNNLFPEHSIDIILLASVIQYFENLDPLLRQLNRILTSDGEIHILDSPIYESKDASGLAKERSANYFKSCSQPEMQHFYFHHTWSDLASVPYTIMEKPRSRLTRIITLSSEQSVFPWIRITKAKAGTVGA
jgi:ubiquinone/menaquinone biosynthesis C-methylase UbiE